MAAGLLPGGAAGVEDGGAFIRRNTGQFQLLEGARGHERDLRPVFDGLWRQLPGFTNPSVRGIGIELEGKEFVGQFGKLLMAGCRLPIGNRPAQARDKTG